MGLRQPSREPLKVNGVVRVKEETASVGRRRLPPKLR